MSGVAPQQRFTRAFRCPVCDGCYEDPQGKGIRCYGFLSSDGEYAHCTRSEYAGRIERHADSETYPHSLQGDCRCGRAHGPAVAPPLPARREPRHPPPGATAAYRYESPEGHLAYIVLRYADPKIFLPCHAAVEDPQITDRTHWWVDLDGINDRFLYRLPELLAADPDEIVFYTEGEKDADRLIAEGLTATTNALGARSWVPEYAEALRGRRVVLLGDNDDDGRDGAKKKAGHLQGVAASVQVVIFSELRKGGDVSDWLDEGHTAQELLTRVNASKPEGPKLLPTIRATDLLAKRLPPVVWAVQDLLPEGLTLFVGKTKMGKSWAGLALGLAIAWGGRVFGKIPVELGEVLYLALEDSERRLQNRINRLTEGQTCPEGLYLATKWPRVDEGGLTHLEAWVKEHPGTRFIIVDTLKRIRPTVGMQKSVYDADYESIQGLQDLATRYHVAVLVVHHMRKLPADDPLDSINGSSGLLAAADGIWVLQRERMAPDATLYVVHREGEDQELALTWTPALVTWTLAGDAQEYRISKERQEIIDLLIDAGDAMTPKEIAEALGRNHSTTKVLLRNMLHSDAVTAVGSGRYAADRSHKPRKPINPTERVLPLFSQQDAKNGTSDQAISGFMDKDGINPDFPRQDAKNGGSVYGFTRFTDDEAMDF